MFLQTILFRIQNSCIIKFKELEYFESSILIKCTTRLNDYIKNQLFLKRILEIQVNVGYNADNNYYQSTIHTYCFAPNFQMRAKREQTVINFDGSLSLILPKVHTATYMVKDNSALSLSFYKTIFKRVSVKPIRQMF